MSNENFLSEAALKDEAKKSFKLKLKGGSVTTDKLADGAVTKEKIANGTVTMGKLDTDLQATIKSATGSSTDLVQKVQGLTKDVAELQDAEFPMVLLLSVNNDVPVSSSTVKYRVTVKGEDFVPDVLSLKKNDTVLTSSPVAMGTVTTSIQSNRETFTLTVEKQGRSTRQTSVTRYLCYYGGNAADTITTSIMDTLAKRVAGSVSFNPKVETKDGDYIWLVVPSYLTISRVTSAGFEVPLATPQTIKSSLGEFKAYRTQNSLTKQSWNLVIA